jgi:hypothetical protein
MRMFILVCSGLFLSALPLGGQSGDADPYFVNMIKFELSMRSRGRKIIHSYTQKNLARLGDGVSVALVKALDEAQLEQTQTIRDILPIIRDAFSGPQFIANQSDREPRVTTFLLTHLRQNTPDAQLKSEIDQTIDFVRRSVQST